MDQASNFLNQLDIDAMLYMLPKPTEDRPGLSWPEFEGEILRHKATGFDIPADFTIAAENYEWEIHRSILAAGSQYFRSLLSKPWADSKGSGGRCELEVEPEPMDSLLRLMYKMQYHESQSAATMDYVFVSTNNDLCQLPRLMEFAIYFGMDKIFDLLAAVCEEIVVHRPEKVERVFSRIAVLLMIDYLLYLPNKYRDMASLRERIYVFVLAMHFDGRLDHMKSEDFEGIISFFAEVTSGKGGIKKFSTLNFMRFLWPELPEISAGESTSPGVRLCAWRSGWKGEKAKALFSECKDC